MHTEQYQTRWYSKSHGLESDEVDPPHCDFIIQTLDTDSLHEQRQIPVLFKRGVSLVPEKDSEGVERDIGNLILLGNIRGDLNIQSYEESQDAFHDHQPDILSLRRKPVARVVQDLRRAGYQFWNTLQIVIR